MFGRIAENNMELQRQDHEREVESLKEELKRLKEEKVGLQRQAEEGDQVTADLQEQVLQLSKHVKVIPELNRDLHNLQNQRNSMERQMKQQSEQARGTGRTPPGSHTFRSERRVKAVRSHLSYLSAAKMAEITRQLLSGVVEEDVLLG